MARSVLHDRVEKDFTHHPPTGRKVEAHERVNELTEQLAHDLVDTVPEGRELHIVLTKLQEVRMWANTGIACNPEINLPREES